MIMNKIVIRIVVFLLAIILLLVLLFSRRNPFGKSNSSFAIESGRDITSIEFLSKGEKLALVKAGESWLINGKTEARKTAVLFIGSVLSGIQIKSPVTPELFENEITLKGIVPVKVKVYEGRKLLKSIIVYKTKSNHYGNIMKINGRSKPFIVALPGYEGDIGSFFTLNELFWQPYTVFNLLPSEIGSVDFENLSDTSSSFSLLRRNHHFTVTDREKELNGYDSTLVTRYLSYFTWIPFESWALDIGEDEIKQISSQQPLYRITVNTTGGVKIILTLWERSILENGMKIKDSDRLLGKIQKSDEFFVMRYFDVDPLLKKRSYFFKRQANF